MALSSLALAALVALAPDTVLLVLNKAEHTLVVVDPVALRVVGRVATGTGPHEVAVAPDGRTAYVTNYGDRQAGHSISVVDLGTLTARELPLDSLGRPHGIVMAGGRVYFTAEVNQAVARLDEPAVGVDWVARTGQLATHMVVASPDGRALYTANVGSASVTRLTLATGEARHIAVGPQPEGIALSPDGGELWVGHNGDGAVSVIDVRTEVVIATLPVGTMPIRLAFTPDGGRILASDARADAVVVIDAHRRAVIGRIPVPGTPIGLVPSSDGRRAFVSRSQAGGIAVLDLERLAVVAEVETGLGPDGLAWAARP
ncbi:MAG: YncE family protein [Gemmatimonadetes bacterium]|jgi:YVTN family beta-propeller protein|nr:YncE family protein [Gemmatimonadota bacterium]MBK7349842.1 YncE family protein [Gemmatimonadota bacterium]MBK7784472.1 YncE family protein [Gemmatimonadota bacterium]MBK7925410.1 YncE family protein [Gemmatimonadota bacterium]MBK9067484.1 YncE family protein [Gemmatimonadota bacterium]